MGNIWQLTGTVCQEIKNYNTYRKMRLVDNTKNGAVYYDIIFWTAHHNKQLDSIDKGAIVCVRGIPKPRIYEDKPYNEMTCNHLEIIKFQSKTNSKSKTNRVPPIMDDPEELKKLYPADQGFHHVESDEGLQIFDKRGEPVLKEIDPEDPIPF